MEQSKKLHIVTEQNTDLQLKYKENNLAEHKAKSMKNQRLHNYQGISSHSLPS